MAIVITDTDVLTRVSFKNDADPDFNGQIVIRTVIWNGLTTLQRAALLASKYQDWVAARAPVSDAARLAAARQALIDIARRRFEMESELGVEAIVSTDGQVTLNG